MLQISPQALNFESPGAVTYSADGHLLVTNWSWYGWSCLLRTGASSAAAHLNPAGSVHALGEGLLAALRTSQNNVAFSSSWLCDLDSPAQVRADTGARAGPGPARGGPEPARAQDRGHRPGPGPGAALPEDRGAAAGAARRRGKQGTWFCPRRLKKLHAVLQR